MEHEELVKIGAKWLFNNTYIDGNVEYGKSQIVITEMACCNTSGEIPDCIGFAGNTTILLEAKTNRADFLKDCKKVFRIPANNVKTMGNYKLYIAPEGLINIKELPQNWGLLEVKGKRVKKIKDATRVESCILDEKALLMSAIRRIGKNSPKGISVRFYVFETKNKATMGLSEEY